MPNHVSNRLEILGSRTSIDDFLSKIKSDDEGDLEIIQSLYPTPEDADFYTWRLLNWGSKWGDYDTRFIEKGEKLVIEFMSAWSPPLEAFQHISTLFPDLIFEGSYDEPMMAFLGAYAFQNGQQIGAFHIEDGDYPQADMDKPYIEAIEEWTDKVNIIRRDAEKLVHETAKLFI